MGSKLEKRLAEVDLAVAISSETDRRDMHFEATYDEWLDTRKKVALICIDNKTKGIKDSRVKYEILKLGVETWLAQAEGADVK